MNEGLSICCNCKLLSGLHIKTDHQGTLIVMEGSHNFGPLIITKNVFQAKWKIFGTDNKI